MKCVFTSTEWIGNNRGKSELLTENKAGIISPLLPIEDGIKTILSVNTSGFTLVTVNREILRQGKEQNVFSIVDSMLFDPYPMKVIDNVKQFEGMFEDYERHFGFGRVERTDTVRFLTYVDKQPEYTAIGITKRDRRLTHLIYSLYFEGEYSNKDIVNLIAKHVSRELKACEIANVNVNINGTERVDSRYADKVRTYKQSYYHEKFEEARLLCNDATRRKTSITEYFDKPMRYESMSLFDVEPKPVELKPKQKTNHLAEFLQHLGELKQGIGVS